MYKKKTIYTRKERIRAPPLVQKKLCFSRRGGGAYSPGNFSIRKPKNSRKKLFFFWSQGRCSFSTLCTKKNQFIQSRIFNFFSGWAQIESQKTFTKVKISQQLLEIVQDLDFFLRENWCGVIWAQRFFFRFEIFFSNWKKILKKNFFQKK